MESHYDEGTRSFTRSFRIGPVADCCAASAGLAKGMSFATWSSSRTDVRLSRPLKGSRREAADNQESFQRAHLNAYIRSVRSSMEGPKGGSDPVDKWHTTYMPISKRWKEYEQRRRAAGLPIIGSQSLFTILWNESGISEDKATGHAKCTRCGELGVEREKYAGRMDEEGKKQLARVEQEQRIHDAEHRGERNYAGESCLPPCRPVPTCNSPSWHISRPHMCVCAVVHCTEDWWLKGEDQPELVTALSMDAPTEKQFDVPVQQRKARDVTKELDGARKWSSKITGLMIAGMGMLAFVSREGIGSGGDLSCTVLYLGLIHMCRAGRQMGRRLHVLLDNTAADNKNNEVIRRPTPHLVHEMASIYMT